MINKNSKPIVFFDRDGTINVEKGYIRKLEDFELITGAAKSIKKLNDLNIPCVLTSNQAGAARGFYDIEHIYNLHKKLEFLLAQENAHLDLLLFCPHLNNAVNNQFDLDCNCRKPATGMLEKAFEHYNNHSQNNCYIIGDKPCDIELAKNWYQKIFKKSDKSFLNIKSILVETGYGAETYKWAIENNIMPDIYLPSICQAVDYIIKDQIT